MRIETMTDVMTRDQWHASDEFIRGAVAMNPFIDTVRIEKSFGFRNRITVTLLDYTGKETERAMFNEYGYFTNCHSLD